MKPMMYVKISLIILVILILSPVIFILYFVYRDYFSGGVRGGEKQSDTVLGKLEENIWFCVWDGITNTCYTSLWEEAELKLERGVDIAVAIEIIKN